MKMKITSTADSFVLNFILILKYLSYMRYNCMQQCFLFQTSYIHSSTFSTLGMDIHQRCIKLTPYEKLNLAYHLIEDTEFGALLCIDHLPYQCLIKLVQFFSQCGHCLS